MSTAENEKAKYHHGNLRAALIDEAVRIIETDGPSAFSMRDLARRLHVSHAAPAHHFPDKAALLTAIATEGYKKLADEQAAAIGKGFLEIGLAYVRFAIRSPGYVKVMFEPSLYRANDPELEAARRHSAGLLFRASGGPESDSARRTGLAGWCLMHGFAMLWLQGNLREAGDDPEVAARRLAEVTFGGPSSGG